MRGVGVRPLLCEKLLSLFMVSVPSVWGVGVRPVLHEVPCPEGVSVPSVRGVGVRHKQTCVAPEGKCGFSPLCAGCGRAPRVKVGKAARAQFSVPSVRGVGVRRTIIKAREGFASVSVPSVRGVGVRT